MFTKVQPLLLVNIPTGRSFNPDITAIMTGSARSANVSNLCFCFFYDNMARLLNGRGHLTALLSELLYTNHMLLALMCVQAEDLLLTGQEASVQHPSASMPRR